MMRKMVSENGNFWAFLAHMISQVVYYFAAPVSLWPIFQIFRAFAFPPFSVSYSMEV